MSIEPPENPIELSYPESPFVDEVLTPQTLLLVGFCEQRFRDRRLALVDELANTRLRCQEGQAPGFLAETEAIRNGQWSASPPPADFETRRAEIVTTLNPNALVNGLASGADSCVVDMRDSVKTDSSVLLRGQTRLRQAASGTLAYQTPLGTVVIGDQPSSLIVRPRLLTDVEPCVAHEGHKISGGIFDVIVFASQSARPLIDAGKTPCLELSPSSYSEAQLWLEILESTETLVRIPRGSLRVSVCFESLNSILQADEILHVFRERAIGLAHGTWRYVQDFLESFPYDARLVHPDRDRVWGLEYNLFASRYLVQVAHKRGTLALATCGHHDSNESSGLRVAGEKLVHEIASDIAEGFDGKRVVCARLVPVVLRSFDTAGITTNQRGSFPYTEGISADQLVQLRPKPITEAGLRMVIRIGLAQLASWTGGRSMMPVDNFLENRSSAAVARLLLHQWIRHPNGILSDGVEITRPYVREIFAEEMRRLSGNEESLGCSDEDLLTAVRILAHSLAEDAVTDISLGQPEPTESSEPQA